VQLTTIFHEIPLWALQILTVLVVLLAVEVGFRVWDFRRRSAASEKDAPIGGLVAFLLAFTFSAASARYDTRKQMVLQEANAIGTAYLRADLLPEPQRTDARNTLVAYTKARSQGVMELLRPEVTAESAALQDSLWATAAAGGNQRLDSPVTPLFVQAVNDVIDLDAARIRAGRNRIPDSSWLTLYVLIVLSMAAIGYQFGLSGTRSWGETLLLVLAFTVVILLIADLDRPQGGAAAGEPAAHTRTVEQDRAGAP
jgi:hypothetical protein